MTNAQMLADLIGRYVTNLYARDELRSEPRRTVTLTWMEATPEAKIFREAQTAKALLDIRLEPCRALIVAIDSAAELDPAARSAEAWDGTAFAPLLALVQPAAEALDRKAHTLALSANIRTAGFAATTGTAR